MAAPRPRPLPSSSRVAGSGTAVVAVIVTVEFAGKPIRSTEKSPPKQAFGPLRRTPETRRAREERAELVDRPGRETGYPAETVS